MRIFIVSQEYPPETGGGGIGTQSRLKALGLSERGHHVEVLSASWKDPRSEHDGKVLVHRMLPSDLGIVSYDDSMQWLAYALSVARELERREVEKHFDIIQFPEYAGEGFFHQTNNFQYRKARYSVQLHGPLAMFGEHMGWPDKSSAAYRTGCFMERSVIHHADGLLASSHNTARFCASFYDVPLERIHVIHSGIDLQEFSPGERDGEDGGSSPRILFVGNLVGAKGFNVLVESVLQLRARYPEIRLRAIGKAEDESLARARERVAKAGAERNAEFLGYVPHAELPRHFAWCDIFSGPSLYEPGPGNVYLEAMACARPVIACNTAGAPEVVLDERTGILVPPQDPPSLGRAIARLAEDPALRARLGSAGRAWVTEQFSIEKYIDKVESFYRRLIDEPRAARSSVLRPAISRATITP